MLMYFVKHQFCLEKERHLFNTEIENTIKEYAEKNSLLLPENFNRNHYDFFSRQDVMKMEIEYKIVFLACSKTNDDVLREQIEFQIKQLEI